MAAIDKQIEAGYERDRITGGDFEIRWWFFLSIPGEKLRNQRARRGVVDRGFRFARGGRVGTPEEATAMLTAAAQDAEIEAAYWRRQPSHALGSSGELLPLDEVRLGLPS
jgi:hypothetical protein